MANPEIQLPVGMTGLAKEVANFERAYQRILQLRGKGSKITARERQEYRALTKEIAAHIQQFGKNTPNQLLGQIQRWTKKYEETLRAGGVKEGRHATQVPIFYKRQTRDPKTGRFGPVEVFQQEAKATVNFDQQNAEEARKRNQIARKATQLLRKHVDSLDKIRARREAAERKSAEIAEREAKREEQRFQSRQARGDAGRERRIAAFERELDSLNEKRLKGEKKQREAQTTAQRKARNEWLDDISAGQKQVNKDIVEKEKARKADVAAQEKARKDRLGLDAQIGRYERRFNMGLLREKRRRGREAEITAMNRDKSMSRMTMGLASAGIGLFGQAGFPLLNIAFASMSGMKYAGIAAVATTIGEVLRGLSRISEAAFESAKQLNFLTYSFKGAEGRWEATKAFYGGMQLSAREEALNRKIEALKTSYTKQFGMLAWSELSETLSFKNIWANPSDFFKVFLPGPQNTIWSALTRAGEQVKNPNIASLEEARNMFVRSAFSYRASFEEPEQMWRRIQSSAASRMPDETKINLQRLRQFDDMIKALKENTEEIRKNREYRETHGHRRPNINEMDWFAPIYM